jgi:hypothetical protein
VFSFFPLHCIHAKAKLLNWCGFAIYCLPITVCACPWCSKLYFQCQTEEYQVDQSNTNWQSILRKNLWTGTLNYRKSVNRSIYIPIGQVLTHWKRTVIDKFYRTVCINMASVSCRIYFLTVADVRYVALFTSMHCSLLISWRYLLKLLLNEAGVF